MNGADVDGESIREYLSKSRRTQQNKQLQTWKNREANQVKQLNEEQVWRKRPDEMTWRR